MGLLLLGNLKSGSHLSACVFRLENFLGCPRLFSLSLNTIWRQLKNCSCLTVITCAVVALWFFCDYGAVHTHVLTHLFTYLLNSNLATITNKFTLSFLCIPALFQLTA